jgi:hypothetical protein
MIAQVSYGFRDKMFSQQFKPQGFYLKRLGRNPLEDVSC